MLGEKKICFVVMGFGKKMDYYNSKEVDLDEIYLKVIKRVFAEELKEYELIRADEIAGSDIIDISMYTLLMKADLVIADITTLNPNALYELGVRHALKPFSTIIMAAESCKLPFDLSHSRLLSYKDIGEVLDENEITEIKNKLKDYVKASEKNSTDSPLYSYLPNVIPPQISDDEYRKILDEAKGKEESIASLIATAEALKCESNFVKAVEAWLKLEELMPHNDYVVQQLTLSLYKSKKPNETMALDKALLTIRKLNPDSSLDLETLGITGAIYKRLFRINRNYDYLDEAIKFYKKGYTIKQDYYNGENYAVCLLLKSKKEKIDADEKQYLMYENKKVCKEVVTIIEEELAKNEINNWMYATLAICYFCIGKTEEVEKYEKIFFERHEADWEKDTYNETKEVLKTIFKMED